MSIVDRALSALPVPNRRTVRVPGPVPMHLLRLQKAREITAKNRVPFVPMTTGRPAPSVRVRRAPRRIVHQETAHDQPAHAQPGAVLREDQPLADRLPLGHPPDDLRQPVLRGLVRKGP